MTTPLLDDDTLIQPTTDETVYMGCSITVINPAPPPPDDELDLVVVSILVTE